MTLKERLEVEIMDLPITTEVVDDIAKNLEYVADDHAIEFAEWVDKHYFQGDKHNVYAKCKEDFSNKEATFNIKQLLEMYKKEREL